MATGFLFETIEPRVSCIRAATERQPEKARRIAEEVVARHASSVDREARFPIESIDALKRAGLLGALLPASLGGADATLADMVEITETLARRCASTAMIFAMHQIQVACLFEHAASQPSFANYLAAVGSEQRLIASATSELGTGGNLRSSIACLKPHAGAYTLEKHAPTISYAEHADDILVTARRSEDAPPSDQVLVLVTRGEYQLVRLSSWNALGMRGTESSGFVLTARFDSDRIVFAPFAEIACQTMVPVSHILWSAVWLGIAGDALERAHRYVRASARKSPGIVPPGAERMAEATARLDTLRSRVLSMLDEYENERRHPDGAERLSCLRFATRINGLKLAASELCVDIVTRSLGIIGMAGYSEDGELSVARHLRDAHSAPLMINNARICAVNAALLLAQKELA